MPPGVQREWGDQERGCEEAGAGDAALWQETAKPVRAPSQLPAPVLGRSSLGISVQHPQTPLPLPRDLSSPQN